MAPNLTSDGQGHMLVMLLLILFVAGAPLLTMLLLLSNDPLAAAFVQALGR